jgi:hydrogenase maturation protease
VVDYGIRGLDLAYALLEDYDLVILVDAVGRGGDPGTVYVLEPESADAPRTAPMDAHGMNPMRVLAMVRSLGGQPKRVLLVGCEPETLGDEFEGAMGLSACVEAALDGAVALVESLIARVAREHQASVMTQEFQKENISHGTYTA